MLTCWIERHALVLNVSRDFYESTLDDLLLWAEEAEDVEMIRRLRKPVDGKKVQYFPAKASENRGGMPVDVHEFQNLVKSEQECADKLQRTFVTCPAEEVEARMEIIKRARFGGKNAGQFRERPSQAELEKFTPDAAAKAASKWIVGAMESDAHTLTDFYGLAEDWGANVFSPGKKIREPPENPRQKWSSY